MREPTDEPAGDTDGFVVQDAARTTATAPSQDRAQHGKLASRPASNMPLRRRIRPMDDPEILERVLAGLLDLP